MLIIRKSVLNRALTLALNRGAINESSQNNMNEAKRFYNFTTEDFIGMWDSVEYPVLAGESMMLPGYLADHFAKHLVNREMQNEGKVSGMHDEFARKPYLDKCFVGETIVSESSVGAEIAALNAEPVVIEESKVVVKKKAGRPKKTEFDEII